MNFFKSSLFVILINFTCLIYAESNLIEINKGQSNPINIAIAQAKLGPYVPQSFANELTAVVKNDLANSGFFRIIPEQAFIERKTGISHTPSYVSWRQINAALLLNMEIKKLHNDEYEVTFILWDNILAKAIAGKSFEFDKKLWRRVAHRIADKIYEQVTAQDGYFDTKIVYVAEYFSGKKKITRLAMMDSDGNNNVYLTDGKNLVSTPRLSPDASKILYLSYERMIAKVFIYDLRTGKEKILGHFKGLSFAPRFSPNGNKAVMSVANNGVINIYEIDMRSFRMKKLTDSFGINTSPCYSP
ncbi:MAG: Tol-Pal system protein TolB, partial [Rickettsiaceae bacterium]|nr:Tol-Pal system protein TolB [Rickettsiaceae bacterium]